MKIGVIAAVAASLLAGSAMAADMPVKAPMQPVYLYNWTGFYAGLHAGYGWGNSDWVAVPPAALINQGSHDINGGLAGGQLGYNWQTGALVIGVELDGSFASIKGNHLDATATLLDTRVRGIGTLSGRIGYAMNNVLVYGKLGGGIASFRYRDTFGAVFNGGANDTRTALLLGAGLEYGFTRNWTGKIEYNYLGFGRDTFTFAGGVAPFGETIRDRLHLVKVGVNYRW